MDELKELVGLINSLPQIALWVMVGFWAYKVIVVGSVYGVIRLAISKAYEAFAKPREFTLDDMSITAGVAADLKNELKRALVYGHIQLNRMDAAWLREAITEKQDRENAFMREQAEKAHAERGAQ